MKTYIYLVCILGLSNNSLCGASAASPPVPTNQMADAVVSTSIDYDSEYEEALCKFLWHESQQISAFSAKDQSVMDSKIKSAQKKSVLLRRFYKQWAESWSFVARVNAIQAHFLAGTIDKEFGDDSAAFLNDWKKHLVFIANIKRFRAVYNQIKTKHDFLDRLKENKVDDNGFFNEFDACARDAGYERWPYALPSE